MREVQELARRTEIRTSGYVARCLAVDLVGLQKVNRVLWLIECKVGVGQSR